MQELNKAPGTVPVASQECVGGIPIELLRELIARRDWNEIDRRMEVATGQRPTISIIPVSSETHERIARLVADSHSEDCRPL